jgi:WD40 repeat protein
MNTEDTNITQDNQEKKPEVYALKQGDQGWKVSRRDFLAASAVAAGALAAGCVPSTPAPTLTPTSSRTPRPTATSTSTPSPTATQTPTQAPTGRPTIEPGLCQNPIAHKGYVDILRISADGAYMVSGCKEDRTVKVWSLPGVQLLQTMNIAAELTDLAISPDGKRMAVVDRINTIHIYSFPECKLLLDIVRTGVEAPIAFDPSGSMLAAGDSDMSVKVYSPMDGSLMNTFTPLNVPLQCMAISPNGKFLAAAGVNSMLGLWSFPEGENINMIDNHNNIYQLAISPDGKNLYTYEFTDQVTTWAIPGFDRLDEKNSRGNLAISPDGAFLIFQAMDNSIEMWETASNQFFKTITGHAGTVISLAISPDGSILAAGNDSGSLYLWSLPAGTLFSCPVDLSITPPDVEGVTYEATDTFGRTVTYTLPCGAPLPEGAVCVCNCVGGSACACVGHVSCQCVGYSECSCVGHVVEEGSHYWYPN